MRKLQYITQGRKVSVDEILEKLKLMIEDIYLTPKQKEIIRGNQDVLATIATQFYEINEAILNKRDVFAICEKHPRNLDSGKHYYSLWYVTAEGIVKKVWGYELYFLIGQDIQSKDYSLDKYIFTSNAIGMSRLLDATDRFFVMLKELTGTYGQLS